MTADTDTIREALEYMLVAHICPVCEQADAAEDSGDALYAQPALAALGRVEERERVLTEALTRIGHRIYGPSDALELARDYERIARAALSSAAGNGEHD